MSSFSFWLWPWTFLGEDKTKENLESTKQILLGVEVGRNFDFDKYAPSQSKKAGKNVEK